MKAIFENKAFTLVELLIVIAIIGMLSVLSIAGYTSYRKNALADFAVESLIAKMHEMKESAIYGVNKTPQCFGLGFVKDGDKYVIGAFKQEFTTGNKQWSDAKMKWVDSGCSTNQVPDTDTFATFDIDPMINVKSIDNDGSSIGSFYVRYNPPNGELEVNFGSGGWSVEKNGAVTVKLQYGDSENTRYERDLIIQLDESKLNYIMPSNVQ